MKESSQKRVLGVNDGMHTQAH